MKLYECGVYCMIKRLNSLKKKKKKKKKKIVEGRRKKNKPNQLKKKQRNDRQIYLISDSNFK